MTKPDFEALRAERNKAVMEHMQQVADEFGCQVAELKTNYNLNACYCACASGGPCEHTWDGEWYEFSDGLEGPTIGTATCSRCGMTAMSHSLRNAP